MISEEEQERRWNDLEKEINRLVSVAKPENIRRTVLALLKLNLERGTGLLWQAVLRRLLNEPKNVRFLAVFTHNLINFLDFTDQESTGLFFESGNVLLGRLLAIFKSAYLKNDRSAVDITTQFLCELVALETIYINFIMEVFLILLGENSTNDLVRTAVAMMNRLGYILTERDDREVQQLFEKVEMFMRDEKADQPTRQLISELLEKRKSGFPEEPENTLRMDNGTGYVQMIGFGLQPGQKTQRELNSFQFDHHYEEGESEYAEWLEENEFVSTIEGDIEQYERDSQAEQDSQPESSEGVTDYTDAELIQTQKTIYLIMMSSMLADEGVHKLLRVQKQQQIDNDVLIDMIVKCCAQEKTYSKYFGVVGEKLCAMNEGWHQAFIGQFREKYDKIYQYEGAQLRNIGKFFGHLLAADVLDPLQTLGCIIMTEHDTTSAGRVFIKFLFQALLEEMGISEVQKLIQDKEVRNHITGMFPVVNATYRDRDQLFFSINFFTAIGLGILTQEMRDVLEKLPEPRGRKRSRSRSNSRSGSGSRSGSFSRSRSYSRSRSGSYSRSQSYSRSRSGSYSRLASPGASRSPLR